MVYGETKTFTKKQHKLEELYERFIILKKAVKSAAVSIYLIFWSFYHITANIKNKFWYYYGRKACPNLSKRENLSISTAKFKILFWLSYIFLGLASVTFVSRVTKLGNSAFPQCFHSVADIQGPAFILFRRTQLGLKLAFMDHEIKYPRIFRLMILSDLLPMKATRYRGWFMKFKTKQFHNSKKIHRAWLKRSFHDI